MYKVAVVLFDIADGSFSKFSELEWQRSLGIWREELGSWEDAELISEEEVIEMVGGDEWFFTRIS